MFPLNNFTRNCSFRLFSGVMFLWCICALHVWKGQGPKLILSGGESTANRKRILRVQGAVPRLGREPSCRALSSPRASAGYQASWAPSCSWSMGIAPARLEGMSPSQIPAPCTAGLLSLNPQRDWGERHEGYEACSVTHASFCWNFLPDSRRPFLSFYSTFRIMTKGWRLRKKSYQTSSWSPMITMRGEALVHPNS